MSRPTFLVLVLSCALSYVAYGQESSSNQASTPPAAATPNSQSPIAASNPGAPAGTATETSKVPMDQAVITLKGVCQPKAGATMPPAADCVSSMTREQFERMTKALQQPGKPPMPPDVLRNFASQYSKLLVFADAARQIGLENDPRVQEIFKFARNQILTDALNQHIVQEYSNISDQQIDDYYKQNPKLYVEVTVQRIMVPRTVANGQPKPTEAEAKAYAEKIRARWVAGEDPVKLQKEAMDHAGLGNSAPDVNLGGRRPGTLPEAHSSVFDLKPGEVSLVFVDPGSLFIYKVISTRQVPLSEVKASISSTLQRQMILAKIDEIQKSATIDLNEAYFGPETKPTVHQTIITPKGAAGGAPNSQPAPPNPNATPAPKPNSEAPPK